MCSSLGGAVYCVGYTTLREAGRGLFELSLCGDERAPLLTHLPPASRPPLPPFGGGDGGGRTLVWVVGSWGGWLLEGSLRSVGGYRAFGMGYGSLHLLVEKGGELEAAVFVDADQLGVLLSRLLWCLAF